MVAAASVGIIPIRQGKLSQLFISRGPVVDDPTAEIFELLDNGLRRLGRENNAIGCRIEPGASMGDRRWPHALRAIGCRPLYPPSQARSTWVLDLAPDEDRLLEAMKPKWRYNIRLAQKRGVEVRTGGADDVDVFYRLYRETATRDGFFIHGPSLYREVFETFASLGQFHLLFAYYREQPIAAVSLVHLGNVVWYLYGASSGEHRATMAPHLLQWRAIQWAKATGATTYDFRGVPDILAPDREMYGVYRFKQGFGGRHLTYLEAYAKPYRPALFGLWKAYWQGRFVSQSLVRRVKGLPVRGWA